ncbi:hypothetical protein CPS_1207 [Colwellia psychrerythraea 34H]|uniref:Uncharacterized protein n=1 Tax=Colwellia psychrerythraea (strain 34H / ATCC BAA-681) TaxID=167879 RepID=Q486R5_COLP3|nr:hypothetical protein CPS_1207 [Colwellia psychrerythraea 34H]
MQKLSDSFMTKTKLSNKLNVLASKYPNYMKLQVSAGIRNTFRQDID